MRVLAAYFSYTGITKQVMETSISILEDSGNEVCVERILPEVDLPAPLWLAQSFFPGSRAPIHELAHDPADFDACLLGLPKWTFACPPINAFLVEHGRTLPPTAVAVTCGGWDQERYLEELRERLRRMGVAVTAGITIRRRDIENGEAEDRLAELMAQAGISDPHTNAGCARG